MANFTNSKKISKISVLGLSSSNIFCYLNWSSIVDNFVPYLNLFDLFPLIWNAEKFYYSKCA